MSRFTDAKASAVNHPHFSILLKGGRGILTYTHYQNVFPIYGV
jgi:glycosylphosphatidylinositol transamidase (GPIT) subunit GPI8